MPEHTCHAPGCTIAVPPKLLSCRPHWYMLPKRLRDAIWAAYRPGQKISKTPSQTWLDAYDACAAYWREKLTVNRA